MTQGTSAPEHNASLLNELMTGLPRRIDCFPAISGRIYAADIRDGGEKNHASFQWTQWTAGRADCLLPRSQNRKSTDARVTRAPCIVPGGRFAINHRRTFIISAAATTTRRVIFASSLNAPDASVFLLRIYCGTRYGGSFGRTATGTEGGNDFNL